MNRNFEMVNSNEDKREKRRRGVRIGLIYFANGYVFLGITVFFLSLWIDSINGPIMQVVKDILYYLLPVATGVIVYLIVSRMEKNRS